MYSPTGRDRYWCLENLCTLRDVPFHGLKFGVCCVVSAGTSTESVFFNKKIIKFLDKLQNQLASQEGLCSME